MAEPFINIDIINSLNFINIKTFVKKINRICYQSIGCFTPDIRRIFVLQFKELEENKTFKKYILFYINI